MVARYAAMELASRGLGSGELMIISADNTLLVTSLSSVACCFRWPSPGQNSLSRS